MKWEYFMLRFLGLNLKVGLIENTLNEFMILVAIKIFDAAQKDVKLQHVTRF